MALAEAGADVVVNDLSLDSAKQTADKIVALGRRALPRACDVSDELAVGQMLDSAVQGFGRLELAVTNAAYSDREPFYRAELAGFRRTIDVTMWGAFYVLRAAALQMLSQPPAQ